MERKYFCLLIQFLLVSGMCAVPINAQDTDASLSDILQAVQKNAELLKEQNTDLMAEEEITIEEFDNNGKVKKTTNIISEYRIIPAKSEEIFNYGISREERKALSAKENGKIKKIKKFVEPVFLSDSSCCDLFVLFDKQNEEHFVYKLINGTNLYVSADKQNSSYNSNGIEEIYGRNIYIIDIEQKEAEVGKINNLHWNLKYKGVALIDAKTMEIFQLNRSRIEVTHTIGSKKIPRNYYLTQHEYDKVKINDQILTLPVARTVKVYRMDGRRDTVYKYKYSNYRAFTVDTKIKYEAID